MTQRRILAALVVAGLSASATACTPRMTKVYVVATALTGIAAAVWSIEQDCGPPNICPLVDAGLVVIGASMFTAALVSANAGEDDPPPPPPAPGPAQAAIPPGR